MLGKIFTAMGLGRKARPRGITWAELMPLFLASRAALALREQTLNNYRIFAARIVRSWGSLAVRDLTPDQFQELLTTRGRREMEQVQCVIRWAVGAKYIATDVTRPGIPRVARKDATPPARLSPSEAHRFYDAVDEAFKPAVALGLFAGVRPFEILRLDWSHVNVQERRLKIPAHVAKTRRARIIEGVPTILWAQLALWERRSGPFVPRNPHARPGEQLGVTAWIDARRRAAEKSHVYLAHDVLRHTFATYFCALYGDPSRAAKILGHYDLRMLAEHYDGVATRAEAEQYFCPKPILALPWTGPKDLSHERGETPGAYVCAPY